MTRRTLHIIAQAHLDPVWFWHWRDGAAHFDRTGVDTQLLPLVNRMRPGQRLLFIRPIVYKPERWKGPWTSRVVARSMEYEGAFELDRQMVVDLLKAAGIVHAAVEKLGRVPARRPGRT